MDRKILSDLIINKIYSVHTIFNSTGKGNKRVNRPRWAVIIKWEGETEYTNNSKTHISNGKNVVLLPKGSTYEWKCTIGGKYTMIEFDSDLFCDEIFSFHIEDNTKILRLFKNTEYNYLLKKSYYNMDCIRLTYEILLYLFNKEKSKYVPTSKIAKIQPAIDYISAYYYRTITNEKLSSLCGISTVYFRKIFTEILGLSPISYVHKIRTEKAKELLKTDYSSLSDIAVTVGYGSIYHFSKMFKQYAGVSPGKFIK